MNILNRINKKIDYIFGKIVFNTIGEWLNVINSQFILIYRPDFHVAFKIDEYKSMRKGWTHKNRRNNGGDMTRFYMLYLNVKHIMDSAIPGDIAELGVYKGNSAVVLAHFSRKYKRKLYLFDTFEVFDKRDFVGEDSNRSVLFTETNLGKVQSLVGEEDTFYVKGFFPDSTETLVMPSQLAIAHIDCDLYEPMKAGLEIFYPKLAPGGLLVLHDYASGHWPGATRAIDEFFADKPERPILMPDKSGSAIVRRVMV